ncbi:hypothetical protein GCM10022261_14240 [Brevibacterium daeguense]|uniref:MOSC domain-containing protein n=1 Tax=Brevibacterium daeguense TaxID=909936 RepID=A0ABP8EIU9_9MICO|nr:MOSC N-terminal beta barrel domain-containing protein [Brevibacterium daeguense]
MTELAVAAFGFAVIKGTRHRPRPESRLDTVGPVGDRRYCLIDLKSGKVLRTVQHPALVTVDVEEDDRGLVLELPTGASVSGHPVPSGQTVEIDYWGRKVPMEIVTGPHAEFFSDLLGREVQLARAPRGGVVFADPVSIATTGSIADLARRANHPQLLTEAARFRATFLIDEPEPFAEERWVGHEVTIGERRLRITAPIGRCGVIDVNPTSGERGSRLLKTLAGYRPCNAAGEPLFGVCAEVIPEEPIPGH